MLSSANFGSQGRVRIGAPHFTGDAIFIKKPGTFLSA
jgi:hypothetical protein